MVCFVLAYVIRLQDGAYAVRSLDYPDCEARNSQGWPAREEFRRTLRDRVHQMINQGQTPVLYDSLADVAPILNCIAGSRFPQQTGLRKPMIML